MISSTVVSTNETAVALGRWLGFTVIGTVPQAFRDATGALVDLFIMHRLL
jgi:hypothetical protein